ncbi:hypothetical protein [Pseudonocardia pini]|uniref:hypothetical protein n=1 Tax=Pseudonocardia pini TaxID=2758030 RepID=UPI0015F05DCF|nr:hypothetical protein [Pseudonocardia pini]
MTLQQSWTFEPEADETPTERLVPLQPVRRRSGPTTWADSASRARRRHRHRRLSKALATLVLLAALTAAAVIWQLAGGRPLELLREGLTLVEPAVDGLRRLVGQVA